MVDMDEQQFKQVQRNTYRDLASSFDQAQKRENRNHLNKIKAISDFLQIKKGDRVLEIGVGTGIHADYLIRMNQVEMSFTCVDYSLEMLQQLRTRMADKCPVDISLMDGECLAFADETFDKIYISGSLHHFYSPEQGVSELIRVLRQGGRFCIMEPNYIFPTNFWGAHAFAEERQMHQMTRANMVQWLSDCGLEFSVTNFAYTPPRPRWALPFFDQLDKLFGRIPILQNLSVMIFSCGVKNQHSL